MTRLNEGLDMLPAPEVGPVTLLPDEEGEGFVVEVLCDGGCHNTPANGQPCQTCHHGCSDPTAGCAGKEE